MLPRHFYVVLQLSDIITRASVNNICTFEDIETRAKDPTNCGKYQKLILKQRQRIGKYDQISSKSNFFDIFWFVCFRLFPTFHMNANFVLLFDNVCFMLCNPSKAEQHSRLQYIYD